LLTNAGDLRALQVFDELQSSSYRVGEGMCVGLLARCAAQPTCFSYCARFASALPLR